jgi:hypothetical protein
MWNPADSVVPVCVIILNFYGRTEPEGSPLSVRRLRLIPDRASFPDVMGSKVQAHRDSRNGPVEAFGGVPPIIT